MTTPNKPKGSADQQLIFDLVFEEDEPFLSPDEIYAAATPRLLERLKEDRRIERKTVGCQGDSLAEYLSMWANTEPDGGLIAVGVSNDGSLVGCQAAGMDVTNKVERVGAVYCPDANYKTKRVEFEHSDGRRDYVILFRVLYHETRVVKLTNGKAFIRLGSSKKELSGDEIRELAADKGQISFEQEPSGVPWPDSFDQGAIQEFTDAVRTRREMEGEHSNEDVLALRTLGKFKDGQFVPNMACLLLFGKRPDDVIPGCKIRFLRFHGKHEGTGAKFNVVKDIFIEGPIPHLILTAESVLESQLRTFSPLNQQGKFFPQPEYPRFAWYEAVVNACAHRSYGNGMKNMPIFVKMFEDRLEVESPGPLPPFVTPANIYEIHSPRNPKLMDALYYLKLVRCAHEGTRRIRDTMAESNLPAPEFVATAVGHSLVRVTLRNDIEQRRVWIDQDVSGLIGEAVAKTLGQNEKRVLNHLAEHKRVNVSDVQRLTGLSWPASRKLLGRLELLGVVRHVHRGDLDRDPQAYFELSL